MNEVKLRGGLVKDPEYVDMKGITKASFTLAVNGTRYDSQQRQQVVKTTFVSCEAWGPVAEQIMGFKVGKGCELMVVGELSQYKREGDDKSHTRVACYWATPTRMTARSQGSPQAEDNLPPKDDNPWGNG